MVKLATVPPCMADARKAAAAIAAQGVSRVVLFGSVARGDAGPNSDIDLVAIHDDLDYSTRYRRSDDLGQLASAATGRRVFVYATDWPEWNHRAKGVPTSLESAITADAVTLYHREPVGVRWGKEIGMPTSDRGEAIGRLHNARRAVFGICTHLAISQPEESALADRDAGYYLFATRDRMCALCADAHMAMETGLKALIHLAGSRPARTHDLDQLLDALPASRNIRLRAMFVNVTAEQSSRWREAGAYEYADSPLEKLVPHAYHMARTAIDVVRYAADRLAGSEAARLIHKATLEAETGLDRWDLTTEDPYETLGLPPPPEPSE